MRCTIFRRLLGRALWLAVTVVALCALQIRYREDLRLKTNQRNHRVAYVVTLNTTSVRFVQTSDILEEIGFTVRPITADFIGETVTQRTFSNKLSILKAIELIAQGQDAWGYVFEDDILKHELSSYRLSDVIGFERQGPRFHYLGVCLLDSQSEKRYTCGRCAHAMGFSKEGATELLAFARLSRPVTSKLKGETTVPFKEPYMDVIVDTWCQAYGGFMVIGPLQESLRASAKGHVGMFIQDRKRFSSIISNAPKV